MQVVPAAACYYVSYFVRWTNDWLCFLFSIFCMYVPCAVKMFHLLTAACQYVSYFVRWTYDWLCFSFSIFYIYVPCAVKMCYLLTAACQYVIFCQADKRLTLFFSVSCMYVPCAVKMFHLLTAACQYVSYFVRWTNDWLCFLFSVFLYVCPLCCKDVPSFDSSLSICVIFCQVDKRLALLFYFAFFVCMPLVL